MGFSGAPICRNTLFVFGIDVHINRYMTGHKYTFVPASEWLASYVGQSEVCLHQLFLFFATHGKRSFFVDVIFVRSVSAPLLVIFLSFPFSFLKVSNHCAQAHIAILFFIHDPLCPTTLSPRSDPMTPLHFPPHFPFVFVIKNTVEIAQLWQLHYSNNLSKQPCGALQGNATCPAFIFKMCTHMRSCSSCQPFIRC